jgi:hypothetical protein
MTKAAPKNPAQQPSGERVQHLIEHLHSLGPMVLGYFFHELHVDAGRLFHQLEAYERLPASHIKALGADIFEATATAAATALMYVKPEGSS